MPVDGQERLRRISVAGENAAHALQQVECRLLLRQWAFARSGQLTLCPLIERLGGGPDDGAAPRSSPETFDGGVCGAVLAERIQGPLGSRCFVARRERMENLTDRARAEAQTD